MNQVAPYVGAWIETIEFREGLFNETSHPMWVRGLKLAVAATWARATLSHPMWVRGLKLAVAATWARATLSHPMWVRGLKHNHGGIIYDQRPSHPMWVRGLKPVAISARQPRVGRTLCGCVD